LVQLNALLHVMQSKFNPCKREVVCLAIRYCYLLFLHQRTCSLAAPI